MEISNIRVKEISHRFRWRICWHFLEFCFQLLVLICLQNWRVLESLLLETFSVDISGTIKFFFPDVKNIGIRKLSMIFGGDSCPLLLQCISASYCDRKQVYIETLWSSTYIHVHVPRDVRIQMLYTRPCGVPYPFTFHHYTHYPETLNSIDVWSFIEFVIPEDIMQILINTTSFLHHGHPF